MNTINILKILVPNQENNLVGILNKTLSFLFHSRNQVHLWHLQTNSFAEHKALNEYYEKIVELADDFAEVCIGLSAKPNNLIHMEYKNYEEGCICNHLEFMCKTFYDISKELSEYKDLENICASILELLHKTKYLITLK